MIVEEIQAAPEPEIGPLPKYAVLHKAVELMQAAPVPDIRPLLKYSNVASQFVVLLIHFL